MHFNSLAYAAFLALVFVGSWGLTNRRLSLFLPWAALALYSIRHQSTLASTMTGLGLLVTFALFHRANQEVGNSPPPTTIALLQLFLQLFALGFITTRNCGLGPFGYAFAVLGVPVENWGWARWILFPFGFGASYLLLIARKVRLLFVLVASYIFYAQWDYRFLPLIWGSSTADWYLANRIAAANNPIIKKRWLWGTIILNLGVLGFFKYFNFGIDSATMALSALGIKTPSLTLQVVLPVGISFFTFESMSYVIDVYRGDLKPQKSYAEYLSFVAFFPHLVAGPIVRPRDLLPQLASPAPFQPSQMNEGLFLIVLGLSKKIIIGDYLALNLVDRVFDAPLMYSALEIYAGVLAWSLQIYCDFSGYTDIAIGSALLLGVRFPMNFNSPYQAHNIVDFWRRWHISLSTWLRDYLYVPLGGNRKGRTRTYFNLLATMILGGLWHGAAWTFVIWGALHGIALALNKWWQELRGKNTTRLPALSLNYFLSIFFTFHFVCVAWVFFRADSLSQAHLIFTQLATLTTHHTNLHGSVLGILALGLVTHFVPETQFEKLRQSCLRMPWPLQAGLLIAFAIFLRKMASTDAVPFVYFQF